MTLAQAREHIGDTVTYQQPGFKKQLGVITSVNEHLVFVKFDAPSSKACYAFDLTLRTAAESP